MSIASEKYADKKTLFFVVHDEETNTKFKHLDEHYLRFGDKETAEWAIENRKKFYAHKYGAWKIVEVKNPDYKGK